MGSKYKLSYDDAKTKCEADGAYLATPRSYKENKFLTDMFPDKHLWIGINDIDSEGNFISVDGHKVSYFRWKKNEPNNKNNKEDAVHIHSDKGFWNDVGKETKFEFVCFRRI